MTYERDRGGARQRGYDTRWDEAAANFKALHPRCLGCEAVGQVAVATVVDHVIPHKGDRQRFWDSRSNWQPACDHCHNVVKPRLERAYEQGDIKPAELWLNSPTATALRKRYPPRTQIGTDGWPV